MLSNIKERLTRRYTGTEMYGTLIVDSPPVSPNESSEGLQRTLVKRYTGTEMCGTLIMDGPPTSTSSDVTSNLKKRYTGTEMYGTLIVDGPVTGTAPSPTENGHPKSSWYDPVNDQEAEELYDLFMSFS